MKALKNLLGINPCSISLFAVCIFFLTFPNGIPFTFATCGSGLSGFANLYSSMSQICKSGSYEKVKITSFTTDTTLGYCQFKVSADVSIWGSCCLKWQTFCFTQCQGSPTATCYTSSVNKINQCNQTGNDNIIWLVADTPNDSNCWGCSPVLVLDVRARSTNCFQP